MSDERSPALVPEVGGGDELRKLCAEAGGWIAANSGHDVECRYARCLREHGVHRKCPCTCDFKRTTEPLIARLSAAAVAR